MENLKIGQSYSLAMLANLPLSVTNTGDRAVRVSIEALVPGPSELRNGAEAIPDVRWASAVPETVDLAPDETKSAALMLTIPDDERLFGRRFQVSFWSHTLPLPGEVLAYGLKSRVIFSIDRERESPGASPSGDFSFTLLPAQIRLGRLARGGLVRLDGGGRTPLRIRNNSTRTLTLEVRALTAQEAGVQLAEGCGDLMRSAEVTLVPAAFSLAPGEEKTISGTVSMGSEKELRGREFVGVIAASVTNLPIKTRIYSQISASTR